MTGYEIAAVVGALAWLPQIIYWLEPFFVKSKVSIITQKTAEIGYTTLGPILNLRLAFSVDNRDIVVSGLKIKLKHTGGEEKEFSWQGIIQNFGQFGSAGVGVLQYDREQTVLAIKLFEENIEERFIRFQEEDYQNKRQELILKANKKIGHLKSISQYNPETFKNSEEFQDLIKFCHQSFNWRAGEYTLSIEMNSKQKFKLEDNIYTFKLTALDIELLEKNKNSVAPHFERELKQEQSDDLQWNWTFPELKPKA